MSSLLVPEVDEVAAMSPAEAEAFARALDRERRKYEAAIATFVHRVGESGLFSADGHRTPRAWGKAACNWSGAEAGRFVKAGAMLARLPSAGALAADGELGVAQLHALAQVTSNPRVQDALAEGEELLVGQAVELDFDDYLTLLGSWERAADADGAHDSQEKANRSRRASASIVGDRFYLDATGGVAAGVQIKEILDAFAKAEFMADWEAGVRQHGDAMCPGLTGRTDAQRRFDALLAIFLRAAGMECTATGPGFTVNLTVGLPAFQHHLIKALGGEPAPLDPNDPGSRCETDGGVPVDPLDMLVAAAMGHVRRVVLDSAGVVVDMGRKQRLFTGPLREAVLLASRWCVWPGCHRPTTECDADHVLPWANAGPTCAANSAPVCGLHNRWKTRGYRTWRDPHGHWHHYRPDGTEIGWRADTQQVIGDGVALSPMVPT
jgi:hypothetical protein